MAEINIPGETVVDEVYRSVYPIGRPMVEINIPGETVLDEV